MDSNVAKGLYAIAKSISGLTKSIEQISEAISGLSKPIDRLGTGNATTDMGAIEFLAAQVGDVLATQIGDGFREVALAIEGRDVAEFKARHESDK
jgi:hypothetical protein